MFIHNHGPTKTLLTNSLLCENKSKQRCGMQEESKRKLGKNLDDRRTWRPISLQLQLRDEIRRLECSPVPGIIHF